MLGLEELQAKSAFYIQLDLSCAETKRVTSTLTFQRRSTAHVLVLECLDLLKAWSSSALPKLQATPNLGKRYTVFSSGQGQAARSFNPINAASAFVTTNLPQRCQIGQSVIPSALKIGRSLPSMFALLSNSRFDTRTDAILLDQIAANIALILHQSRSCGRRGRGDFSGTSLTLHVRETVSRSRSVLRKL